MLFIGHLSLQFESGTDSPSIDARGPKIATRGGRTLRSDMQHRRHSPLTSKSKGLLGSAQPEVTLRSPLVHLPMLASAAHGPP